MTSTLAGPEPPSSDPLALKDFVQELALALHKRSIYPASHPMLQGAVERLWRRISRLAADRGAISIGIAREQVIVEGVATDDGNPLLREFAIRLHEHQIAAVRIRDGVKQPELDDLVTLLATTAARLGQPLGTLPPTELNRWEHVALYPAKFDKLRLLEEENDPDAQARATLLWLGLARAALASDGVDDAGEEAPDRLAEAIELRAEGEAYLQVVVGYLSQVADECAVPRGPSTEYLRNRLSELMRVLRPDTLARLLTMGGDLAKRGRFLAQTTSSLSAGAVVEIVKASATLAGKPISTGITRLLTKLANNAESGHFDALGADQALRRHVKQLVSEWTLDDPNSDSYNELLGELATGWIGEGPDLRRDAVEPERTVEISLDADAVGEDTIEALERLTRRDGLTMVLERLHSRPPSSARDALLDRLLTADMVAAELRAERPDVVLLSHAARRLGARAVPPLLEALRSRGEGDREWLVDLLVLCGTSAAAVLAETFHQLPVELARVLIQVFERLESWPALVDPRALVMHPDAALRRDVLRVLLGREESRLFALQAGLRDADERVFALALATAMKERVPEVAGLLIQRAESTSVSTELRARSMRALASSGSVEGMRWLAGVATRKHWLWRRPRIHRKSSMVLAAITGLSTHWREAPEAQAVLKLAAGHRDAEIRSAAARRQESS